MLRGLNNKKFLAALTVGILATFVLGISAEQSNVEGKQGVLRVKNLIVEDTRMIENFCIYLINTKKAVIYKFV
ncbi:hypothetical protein SLA2020_135230 [Shorea laevis]